MAKGMAFIIAMYFLLLPFSAMANSYHPNGEMLLHRCERTIKMIKNRRQEFVSGWCLGFVQGALNSHRVYAIYLAGRKPKESEQQALLAWRKRVKANQLYCIPRDTSLGEVIEKVVLYLKTHQKLLNYDASFLIHRALNNAYPCRKES